jgi:SAM-dependent methyltransferase
LSDRQQAIRVGRITAVAHAGHGELERVTDRLSSHGYDIRRTRHFVVGRRPPASERAVVMHTLDEATIDEDVATMVAEELGPLGLLASDRDYGETLFAIVASTCPTSLSCARCGRLHLDNPAIWRHLCLNTLRRLRTLIGEPDLAPAAGDSHVAQFAAVYRRIVELRVGGSLLDVGSNLGLLPVLLAERDGGLATVGCDNRPESIACAADLAAATGVDRATFLLRDVLAPDFPEVGRFDTVTAVHVLEHFAEETLPAVLAHLLDVTARRLIVAVPYEAVVQPLYGHLQAFTPDKLRRWGAWCVDRLGGGRSWCEEVAGGLLIVDRPEIPLP